MDLRSARKLTAALLPLISLGLIITSFVTDDWYSAYHLDGEKSEGSIWSEHRVEYGLNGFVHVNVWSGILGDNFKREEHGYEGELEELTDHDLTSLILMILLHIPLLIIGFVSALRNGRSVLPIMLALIILIGSIIVIYQTSMNFEGAVHDHIDDGLPPSGIFLEEEVKEGLTRSGSFGMSYYLLLPTPFILFLSIILLIDIGREREPTNRDIEKGFFRN